MSGSTHRVRDLLGTMALLGLALGLQACSAGMKDGMAGNDTGYLGDADTALRALGSLRIDVEPPSGTAAPELLPQSHIVPAGRDGYAIQTIDLLPTVTLSGTLTADVARGWASAVEVPTTSSPIVATLNASVGGTRLGGTAISDVDGTFSLALPAYDEDYLLTVVPDDATQAPFHVETRRIRQDAEVDLHLDVGIPVYGRVTDADGEGVSGVRVRVVRTTVEGVEVRSAPVETDETGWYVARVESTGAYVVEVEGGAYIDSTATRVIPTVREDVLVESGEDGASAYLELGELTAATVDGTVLDAGGNTVDDALVRFTSASLSGAEGSLTVEATTGNGDFVARLLPGVYDVEVIPPYDAKASPALVRSVEVSERDQIGTIQLEGLTTLDGRVVDIWGEPAANVVVAATQQGFQGYVWSATTDAYGEFSMNVPVGTYDTTFTPSSVSTGGALTTVELVAGEPVNVQLAQGVELRGTVLWDGEAVPWAWIDVRDDASGVLVGRGTTNDLGEFLLQVSPSPAE